MGPGTEPSAGAQPGSHGESSERRRRAVPRAPRNRRPPMTRADAEPLETSSQAERPRRPRNDPRHEAGQETEPPPRQDTGQGNRETRTDGRTRRTGRTTVRTIAPRTARATGPTTGPRPGRTNAGTTAVGTGATATPTRRARTATAGVNGLHARIAAVCARSAVFARSRSARTRSRTRPRRPASSTCCPTATGSCGRPATRPAPRTSTCRSRRSARWPCARATCSPARCAVPATTRSTSRCWRSTTSTGWIPRPRRSVATSTS